MALKTTLKIASKHMSRKQLNDIKAKDGLSYSGADYSMESIDDALNHKSAIEVKRIVNHSASIEEARVNLLQLVKTLKRQSVFIDRDVLLAVCHDLRAKVEVIARAIGNLPIPASIQASIPTPNEIDSIDAYDDMPF